MTGALTPTWPHDRDGAHPELEGLPTIEEAFRAGTAGSGGGWGEGGSAGGGLDGGALAGGGLDGGDRIALVDGEVRHTAAELEDLVRRLAGALAARGVGRGDAVSFQLPCWWETVAVFRACWALGAVASPVHHLAAGADVERILDQVEPTVVVSAPDLPAAKAPGAVQVRGDGGFEELLRSDPHTTIDARPGDVAVVMFTSGSTGGPKGVLLTHQGLVYKARTLLGVHGLGRDDVVLVPSPMAHIAGLSNAVMLPGVGGFRAVMMDRWDAGRALDLIRDEGVTFMMGPPTYFQMMMAAPGFSSEAVATMRLISCGGAGVTPAFARAASEAFGAVVKRTYGSTEAPAVTTWHAGDPLERAWTQDGRATGSVRIRVVDPTTGEDRPAGEPGEVWLRGPELFVGYTDPTRNEGTITDDGWFRTGDLGVLDEDGWLQIVGRIKDLIIRGGENISASDVEQLLEAHPRVRQAIAVGQPDPRLGERLCAFVVADGPFDLPECQRWFEEHGATKFTWPERVEVVDELPILPSGKVDRARLREIAAEGVEAWAAARAERA